MKNSSGATWDAATAGNTIGTWTASFGEEVDVVASNNDGMGMSMFNAWSKENKVPTFGYDANSDAVAAIAEGYGGTISQHADVQALNIDIPIPSLLEATTSTSSPNEAVHVPIVLQAVAASQVAPEEFFIS